LKNFQLAIDGHDGHVDILRELALQETHGRVTGEPSGVVVPTLKDHRHQANLAERIELRARTACGYSFTSLDKAKRYDSLLLPIVKYLEIFRFKVVDGVPLLVAYHDIQKDFLASFPYRGLLRGCGWILLGVAGRSKRQCDKREREAHNSGKVVHLSFPFLKTLVAESS
jgi:hypothetical protein